MQKITLLIALSLLFFKGYCQVGITGLACVTQKTQYQYIISGIQDSSMNVQLCVTGGSIVGTTDTCVSSNNLSQALIIWGSNTNEGTITVHAGSTSKSLEITVIPILRGGEIDTSLKNQFIDSFATPKTITCTLPTGGSCRPSYSYQWQHSDNNLNWSNVEGATQQNLSFDGPISGSGYYRRVTNEGVSGSVAYSNVIAIFLNSSRGTGFLIKGKLNNRMGGLFVFSQNNSTCMHS